MPYETIALPAPDIFEGKSPGSSTLIIGGGPSTKQILPYKSILKDFFNNIIVVNFSFQWFDDASDYHIVTEKTSKNNGNKVPVLLNDGDYRKDIPRIVNWKGISYYPQDHNLHKCSREQYNQTFDPKKYAKGFLTGPLSHQGFALGSSTLSAMHFAAMLGSNSITLVGADLIFKDEWDHWYEDRVYRDPQKYIKPKNLHQIVEVDLDGRKYTTTAYFRDTAALIDQYIPLVFNNQKIYDFSNGLIKNAIPLNIDYFFK